MDLIHNFHDYIAEFNDNVFDNGNMYEISYTPYTFELIDKDLDCDELYYENMMNNFDKFLKNTCVMSLKNNEYQTIIVNKHFMTSRYNKIIVETCRFQKTTNTSIINIEDTFFKTV